MKRKRKAMTAGLESQTNSKIQALIYQDLTARLISISPDVDISLMKKMINYYMDVYYSEKNCNAEILLNAYKSIKDTISPTEDEIIQAFVKNASGDHKLSLERKASISKEQKYNKPEVKLNKISETTLEEILSRNYNFMDPEELEEYVHFLQNILEALREVFGDIPNLLTNPRSEKTGENRLPLEQSLRWQAGYLQKQIRKYEQQCFQKSEIREITIGIDFFDSQSSSENWKTVYEKLKQDENSLCAILEKTTSTHELKYFWASLSTRITSSLMTEGYCKLTPKAKNFISHHIVKINEDMKELKTNTGYKANLFKESINLKPAGIKLLSAFLDFFKGHETRIMQEISEKYKLRRLKQNQQNSARAFGMDMTFRK
jgi:hypothetical protein